MSLPLLIVGVPGRMPPTDVLCQITDELWTYSIVEKPDGWYPKMFARYPDSRASVDVLHFFSHFQYPLPLRVVIFAIPKNREPTRKSSFFTWCLCSVCLIWTAPFAIAGTLLDIYSSFSPEPRFLRLVTRCITRLYSNGTSDPPWLQTAKLTGDVSKIFPRSAQM
jgi:hypothetical protein